MMKSLYDVPAPAKLNLFLHITGRRPDGYHLLQSAMVLIDWCDTLHFEHRADGSISREDLGTPLPADDLIVRAARALQRAAGTTQGVHILVDKRIPSQAGMGGGSSDAASHAAGLAPAVEPGSAAGAHWRRSACSWEPTCRFFCREAMPGSKELVRKSSPLEARDRSVSLL